MDWPKLDCATRFGPQCGASSSSCVCAAHRRFSKFRLACSLSTWLHTFAQTLLQSQVLGNPCVKQIRTERVAERFLFAPRSISMHIEHGSLVCRVSTFEATCQDVAVQKTHSPLPRRLLATCVLFFALTGSPRREGRSFNCQQSEVDPRAEEGSPGG